MKHAKISTILISIGIGLFTINLWTMFLVYETIDTLKENSVKIDQAGILRGMIQRIAKIEISQSGTDTEQLTRQVDQILEAIKGENHRKQFFEFYAYINSVSEHWGKMKALFRDFSKSPSPELKNRLLIESEACWGYADNAVIRIQTATESKVLGIRVFYFILLVFAFTTLLVIAIVFIFVRHRLEYQATHDSLTGLLNRYSYEMYMDTELERRNRYGHDLSVILVDLDHFKVINDNFGHKAGDQTLREVAEIMKSSIRKSDAIFRIGGEEFAIVTPESSSDEAFQLAEKIRLKIKNSFVNNVPSVTISLGISDCKGKQKCSEILREADEALYKAKNNGRNQAQIYNKT